MLNTEKTVLFTVEQGIGLITLSRPVRRNAINQDLLINLYDRIDEVACREDITSAIITGNGKSFCSALDLDVLNPITSLIPEVTAGISQMCSGDDATAAAGGGTTHGKADSLHLSVYRRIDGDADRPGERGGTYG